MIVRAGTIANQATGGPSSRMIAPGGTGQRANGMQRALRGCGGPRVVGSWWLGPGLRRGGLGGKTVVGWASTARSVTASLRTAISDLQLDAAYIVSPVASTWQAADNVTILPVTELAARLA